MKMLVIAACLVNMNDDKGGQHAEVGDIVDITKQQAENLARADRVLYVNRKDDPTKTAQFTATEAMLKAADELSKPVPPAKDPK